MGANPAQLTGWQETYRKEKDALVCATGHFTEPTETKNRSRSLPLGTGSAVLYPALFFAAA